MPPSKTYIKISYPRKCTICAYVANNPAMYHFHRLIHQSVPIGQLCELGCGKQAIIRGTGGKYRCSINFADCSSYKNRLKEAVLSHWQRDEAIIRKNQARNTFIKTCANNYEVRKKLREVLAKKFKLENDKTPKDYRSYARRCRKLSQIWAKENGFDIGRQTFHVDHKVSIWDSFHANLPPSIASHPANLQVIEAKKNESKGYKSSLTVEELLSIINERS